VRRGEVYWCDFRAPNKRRPVLVLTGSHSLRHLSTATVAALTTTARNVASQVRLSPELGLPKACSVNLHHVFTVNQVELGPFLTALPDEVMASVDRAMVFALGVGERSSDLSLH
jgi:mRNA interferase MazF